MKARSILPFFLQFIKF